jgi:hypothetical protein
MGFSLTNSLYQEFIALSIIMFRISELRHKRLYDCKKKRLNTDHGFRVQGSEVLGLEFSVF